MYSTFLYDICFYNKVNLFCVFKTSTGKCGGLQLIYNKYLIFFSDGAKYLLLNKTFASHIKNNLYCYVTIFKQILLSNNLRNVNNLVFRLMHVSAIWDAKENHFNAFGGFNTLKYKVNVDIEHSKNVL